jgi:hypothetical protein
VLNRYSGKIADMGTGLVSRIVFADFWEGKKVIFGQEIVTVGSEGCYKTVSVEPSAVITESAIPETIEIGSSFKFHAVAVVAAVGTDMSQDFVERSVSFFTS